MLQRLSMHFKDVHDVLAARSVGHQDDLDQEGHKEENFPEVVQPGTARVLDDQVALTPVSCSLAVLLRIGRHHLVVVDLEEELHEVFVAVAELEVWLHVVLIQVLSQNLLVPINARLLALIELASCPRIPLLQVIIVLRLASAAET